MTSGRQGPKPGGSLRPAPRAAAGNGATLLLATLLLAAALGGCSDDGVVAPAPQGATWTRVTDSTFVKNPYYPDWRGYRIAYSATVEGYFRIVTMERNGAGIQYYTGTPFRNDIAPRFVNDSLVVFWSNRSGGYDIWYLNLHSGIVRRLTTGGTQDVAPAPRPGAPGLAYCEAGPTTLEGRVVLIPDTASVPLEFIYLTPDTMFAGEPDWDPTGTRVAFSSKDEEGFRHIWVATLGGTDTTLTQLTTGQSVDMSPRWSPDGRHIAFTSDRSGRYGVWRVDPAGEAQGLDLISFDEPGAKTETPAWASHGRSIVVSSTGSGFRALWVLNDLGL
jgi:Tol biopolymer transport system component